MKQTIPVPPAVAYRLANAARANAQRLVSAARVLINAEHFGPASSLAISAREETAKFANALFLSLTTPDGTDAKLLTGHHNKQALGSVLASVNSLIDFDQFGRDVAVGSERSGEAILRNITDQLIASADAVSFNEEALPDVENDAKAAADGRDEAVRQRGIYVDPIFVDGVWSVSSPIDVLRADAEAELRKSEEFLSFLTSIEERIEIDDALDDVSPPDENTIRKLFIELAPRLFSDPGAQ